MVLATRRYLAGVPAGRKGRGSWRWVPVGRAEITQADTLWAGLSGVWRAVVRGRVGSRQQRSLWVKSRTSGQLQIAQGHRSQKRKDFCKMQATKISHLLSSASRSLPEKCGLRGLLPLREEPSAPPAEPVPMDREDSPGTKASLLQLHPFCFILFVSHKGKGVAWRHCLSVNRKALHSDGSHTSHACNSLESLLLQTQA